MSDTEDKKTNPGFDLLECDEDDVICLGENT